MSRPRVLVLRAPGINCERETFDACQRAGGDPELVHVKQLLAAKSVLDRFAVLVVPGGFAYGDDIAAGRVLANELRQQAGGELLRFVERGGLVLGICNGFQVLVRLGLLPRAGNSSALVQEVTLLHNLSDHYECRWVTLESLRSRCVFVPEGLTLRFPAAHGEGYLQPKDAAFGRMLAEEGYAVFVYVDAQGEPTTEYPANPNGSPAGLAGLTDVSGRVLGLMPHPDRAYLPFHAPDWRRTGLSRHPDGMVLFDGLIAAARAAR
jgi:phosphoribosylformylglycinamidine synthase